MSLFLPDKNSIGPNGMCDTVTHRENPFSVHRVQPGSLEYLFPGCLTITELVDKLAGNGWWGEIVGRHGSGKSTLLATLVPRLRERGFAVVHLQFRMGEHHLPRDWAANIADDDVVVAVDGMEQLGWLARRRLKRDCRRRGWGLVATTHTSLGLPALYDTTFDLSRLERVVAGLLAGQDWTVEPERLRQIYDDLNGDMREMLFCLYDLYEAS
jgi:hypothetical protein